MCSKKHDESENMFEALRNAAPRTCENRKLAGVSVRRNVVAEVVGRQPDPEKRVPALRVKTRSARCAGTGV